MNDTHIMEEESTKKKNEIDMSQKQNIKVGWGKT